MLIIHVKEGLPELWTTLGQGHQTFSVKGQMEDILRFSSHILCRPNYSILRGTAPGRHMVGLHQVLKRNAFTVTLQTLQQFLVNLNAYFRMGSVAVLWDCGFLGSGVLSPGGWTWVLAPGGKGCVWMCV